MSTRAAALAAVAAAGPRPGRDWARAPSDSTVSCRAGPAGSAAPSAAACPAITPGSHARALRVTSAAALSGPDPAAALAKARPRNCGCVTVVTSTSDSASSFRPGSSCDAISASTVARRGA